MSGLLTFLGLSALAGLYGALKLGNPETDGSDIGRRVVAAFMSLVATLLLAAGLGEGFLIKGAILVAVMLLMDLLGSRPETNLRDASADESAREEEALSLDELYGQLRRVFPDPSSAHRWLHDPLSDLDGHSPADAIEAGQRRHVAAILARYERGGTG